MLKTLVLMCCVAIDDTSVVRLDNDLGEKTYGGTCVVVQEKGGRKLLFTNRHSFEGPNGLLIGNVTVRVPKKRKPVPAVFIAASRLADLAALSVDAKQVGPVVPISEAEPKDGEILYQVSYPGSFGPVSQEGACQGMQPYTTWRDTQTPIWLVDCDNENGDSGSPYFNKQGKLVLLHFGGTFDKRGPKYPYVRPSRAVGRTEIVEFLEVLKGWEKAR